MSRPDQTQFVVAAAMRHTLKALTLLETDPELAVNAIAWAKLTLTLLPQKREGEQK